MVPSSKGCPYTCKQDLPIPTEVAKLKSCADMQKVQLFASFFDCVFGVLILQPLLWGPRSSRSILGKGYAKEVPPKESDQSAGNIQKLKKTQPLFKPKGSRPPPDEFDLVEMPIKRPSAEDLEVRELHHQLSAEIIRHWRCGGRHGPFFG